MDGQREQVRVCHLLMAEKAAVCKCLSHPQLVRPELMTRVLRCDLQSLKGFFGTDSVNGKCRIRQDANETCLHERDNAWGPRLNV